MAFDARGSMWGKWDLHVHTPASIVHNYPGEEEDAWEQFLEDLATLPPAFKAIGINDYLFLDGYIRVREAKAAGRLPNLELILPVVELRLDSFGGTESQLSKANYHVIFSDLLDPQIIQEQFLSALSRKFDIVPRHKTPMVSSTWSGVVSRASLQSLGAAIINSLPEAERHRYGTPLQEGFNHLTLPLTSVTKALDSSFLRGRYVTAVGKTEWADIKWKDGSIADKKNIMNGADCSFTAAESPSAYHRARQSLRKGGVRDKLIDCSDAHHLSSADHKDRVGNCFTWIKADPTFSGLLQALQEFEQRLYVGEEPPQVRRVREHPSRYVDRIEIRKNTSASTQDDWFDIGLPLNSGLVAIIGNKGSGKSALAEALGLVGGSPHDGHFSFLTDSKFRSSRQRLAEQFSASASWTDGTTDTVVLSERRRVQQPKVQHLPQRYLESLCTEVPTGEKTQFDVELERIIFAHLPIEERLGAQSLGEVVAIISAAVDTELAELRSDLASINREIAAREAELNPDAQIVKWETYRSLRREWATLQSNPPAEVPEPDQSDPTLAQIRQRLRDLGRAREHLEKLAEQAEADLAAVRRDQADLSAFRSRLESMHRQHVALRTEARELFIRMAMPETVSTFTIDVVAMDEARTRLAESEASLVNLLEDTPSGARALHEAIAAIDDESSAERARLSAPEEARETYLGTLAAWQRDVAALRGDAEADPETALGARRAVQRLRRLPAELDDLRAKRIHIVRRLHRLIKRKANESASVYAPLQAYVDSQELPEDYTVSVGTSLVDTGFSAMFLEGMVNRHVAGSFCGVLEGDRILGRLAARTNFDSEDSVVEFVESIDEHLRRDMRQQPPTATVASSQVRKGRKLEEVYDLIFSLSYLSPRYGLLFGGKPIYQLSPGEKGTLLLIFFLIAELDTRPLIIDQPEDNLDNNTVYRALVRCFQRAKERRQVLIVTHNPNLAVVCDADQVIVASMTKAGNVRVTYRTGAIERIETVRSIVDILEGTHPAFENRSVKYTIHMLPQGVD